jgi:hypothetical protein
MGCDYIVYIYLEIKHKEGIAYIELDNKKGWFCDCIEPDRDSDDEEENNERRYQEYIKIFLKPSFKPIMIYDNNRFLKQSFEDKYLHLIQQKAESERYWRDIGTLLNLSDIQQIQKIEIRQER